MNVLIGITAGIAAYKIPFLIRSFSKAGMDVKCIMTPDSVDFLSPLVVSTLSKNPVGISFWNKDSGEWANHVAYGEWADVFVIAPCTANTLHKMASGACDNLLLATYLSMRRKTIIVPAMDLDMYQHPSVRRNMDQVTADGVTIIPSTHGELASGLVGEGRMEEPEKIFEFVMDFCKVGQDFSGTTAMVTAGPTFEPIDPVRYIGNHSSGKMGFALAEALAERGAKVILIAGPHSLNVKNKNIQLVSIVTADEMLKEVQLVWDSVDVGIFAAAVSDFKPKHLSTQKIKKGDDPFTVEWEQNPDILAWAGTHKKGNQFIVGFALETENEEVNALEKLKRKKASCIVLNSFQESNPVFNADYNKVTIFDESGNRSELPLLRKNELANEILDRIKIQRK